MGKYRSVIRAVLSAQWAIMPEKLAVIVGVLNERAAGRKASRAEIAARLGGGHDRSAVATQGSVAVLNIFGTIAQHVGLMEKASGGVSTDAIGAAFDAAMNDPNVSAIVLNIDSPGGTVAGTPELAEKIFAARGKKQVIAVANSLAASAAYWIGSAAEKFIATPSASVGSIGVLSIHQDDTKAMEKAGIKETVVSAGKFKAEGWGALSDEARAAMQERVDSLYLVFIDAVAKHRGVSVSKVKKDYGEGRALLAQDALAAGMVDRIASLDQVFRELGVGVVGGTVRRDAPAFSMEGLSMNPELFGALVRVGMCPITATQAEAENALDRFYAVKGKAKPAEVASQVADLKAHLDGARPTEPAKTVISTTTSSGAADRTADIFAAVKLANLGDVAMDFAQELIGDTTLSVSDALKKINAKASEVRKPVGATIQNGAAETEKFQDSARSALLNRTFSGSVPKQIFSTSTGGYVDYKPAAFSRSLQSLPRLAAECLIRDGFNATAVQNLEEAVVAQVALGVLSPGNVGLRAEGGGPYNTTGTFSNLLMDAANVVLRRSYDEVPTTFQAWAKRAEDIRDFKTINRVIAGEIGDPRVVPEGGEFDEATMTDGKESYSLRVWGQIFYISWQAIVNDQLSAFTEIPRKQGVAMRRKQNKLVYGVLKDNGTLNDTGALFNATAVTTAGGHANLTTGAGAPSVTTLNALELAMAKQRGLDPNVSSTLGLRPRFILAGAALAATIDEVLGSSSYAVSNGNSGIKNRWQNALTPVIDEELGLSAGGSDTAWYLAASTDQIDTVEYAFLAGYQSPSLASMSDFDRLAVKYRIFQPFAAKAIDFRGLQKHAGA